MTTQKPRGGDEHLHSPKAPNIQNTDANTNKARNNTRTNIDREHTTSATMSRHIDHQLYTSPRWDKHSWWVRSDHIRYTRHHTDSTHIQPVREPYERDAGTDQEQATTHHTFHPSQTDPNRWECIRANHTRFCQGNQPGSSQHTRFTKVRTGHFIYQLRWMDTKNRVSQERGESWVIWTDKSK